MTTATASSTARLTGLAPQFLVDNLNTAIAYYRANLGFDLDFCYESFYASVSRNGFAIHLQCAPKTVSDRAHRKQHEHLDVHITVSDVATLYAELQSRGALIIKPLEERPWSCTDFYVKHADGYILCFSEPTA